MPTRSIDLSRHCKPPDSTISSLPLTSQVPDAQVYAGNLAWFNSVPPTFSAIAGASEEAMVASLSRVKACEKYAMERMATRGVAFYTPSAEELRDWIDRTPEQCSEWNAIKTEFA